MPREMRTQVPPRVEVVSSLLAQRQMWWHGGAGLTERSERGTLSAVATHALFDFFICV